MNHDLSSSQIAAILDTLVALPDTDSLPSHGNWGVWAKEYPEAVAWTLDALQKKKLSTAFRIEYRKQLRAAQSSQLVSTAVELERLLKVDAARLPSLPAGSFFLQAQIELEQPMMTRDDRLFSVSDNVVRKDRVFGWPHLAASSWKGCFRAALYQMGFNSSETRSDYDRIWGVGPEKDDPDSGRTGRLHFYPTFFHRIDFRMLNPQSRLHRSGGNPVELEVVPEKEKGWFQLLYVPYYVYPSNDWKTELAEDWSIVGQVSNTMLRTTGFGAKVSLGFGSAKDAVTAGTLRVSSETGWHSVPFQKISELPSLAVPGDRP